MQSCDGHSVPGKIRNLFDQVERFRDKALEQRQSGEQAVIYIRNPEADSQRARNSLRVAVKSQDIRETSVPGENPVGRSGEVAQALQQSPVLVIKFPTLAVAHCPGVPTAFLCI